MSAELVPGTHCKTWPKDALRVAFGVIWLIDATFKWLPGFRSGYSASLQHAAQAQPGWLHWWFSFWINLQSGHASLFAYMVALTETAIGLALVLGFARKVTYIFATAFSFLIWGIAEGFGGPYMNGSTDIGAAIMYSVVFLFLLALNYYAGTSRYSADYYIEQRVSWWWHVAEMRRPAPATVVLASQPSPPPAPADVPSVSVLVGNR